MPTARGLPPDALDKLVQALDDLVTAAIRRIAAAVARVIKGSPGPAAINPVDDAAMILPLWATATTVTLMPAVQSTWVASATALSEEFAAAGATNSPLGPDQAAAYLEGASNRLVGIGNVVWQQVRTQLAEGVTLGEGIPELAARVVEAAGVSEERARVIARTEVISASNAASFAQAQTLQDSTMTKEWMATPDDRTRHDHVIADGQTQALMAPFEVGGFPLMWPGDPAGPPGEVINCRCTLGYHFADEHIPPDETTVAAGHVDNNPEFNKLHPRGEHGKFGHGHKLAALTHALEQTAEDEDGAVHLDGGRYFDYSAGDYMDIGNGPDDTVQIDMDDAEKSTLAGLILATRVADDAPPADPNDPRSIMLAALAHNTASMYLADGRYFDWSTREPNGDYRFEAGTELDSVRMTLTPDEMDRVALGLTSTLINQPATTASVLTAAAQVHTGAMVALAPCVEDAYRLEVGAGEPAEQLHATLVYLGDDANLTTEQRHSILDLCAVLAESRGPLELDAFGVSIFNPTSDERDTAIVLPLGGEEGPDLAALHDEVTAGVRLILGDAMPQNHEPWNAHLTLAYTDDLSMAEEWTDRNGPILFDHLRVAFGGDVFDIPMSTCGCGTADDAMVAAGKFDPNAHPRNPKGGPGGGRFRSLADRVADAVKGGDHELKGLDREQARKAAKAHGIPLTRGESESSIKAKLVDKLGGKGAPVKKPDQPKAPAKRAPRKAAVKKTAPKAPPEVASRAAEVARINDTPIVGQPRRLGGTMGITSLEEHEGGTLVRKDEQRFGSFKDHPDDYGRDPAESADAEELVALVGQAVGVRTPAILRTGPTEVLMEHIDGKSGADIVSWGKPPPDELVNSDSGRLMGLLDAIVVNADRNEGNWILTDSGDIAGIDHADSFDSAEMGLFTGSVFAAHFIDVNAHPTGPLGFRNDFGQNDMSPDDMVTMRARLVALRSEFERTGRGAWFDAMMERFDQIAGKATGTKSRLVGA